MNNIKVKNITLMDEVETKEAEKLYNDNKFKYCAIYLIPLLFLIITTIFFIVQLNITLTPRTYGSSSKQETSTNMLYILLTLMIISIILTIIGFSIYNNLMQPYKKLLRIAILNDRIRHEEKVREQERRRLQKEFNNNITTEDINNTYKKNIEKKTDKKIEQKTKNIKKTKD